MTHDKFHCVLSILYMTIIHHILIFSGDKLSPPQQPMPGYPVIGQTRHVTTILFWLNQDFKLHEKGIILLYGWHMNLMYPQGRCVQLEYFQIQSDVVNVGPCVHKDNYITEKPNYKVRLARLCTPIMQGMYVN